jgi:hypothetical protein
MPTKATEKALFGPGNLVKTKTDIYSTDPSMRIGTGTVGTVLRGPDKDRPTHCQVHFLAMSEPWWVHYNEIEPYLPV